MSRLCIGKGGFALLRRCEIVFHNLSTDNVSRFSSLPREEK
jgi:hypothetical protein